MLRVITSAGQAPCRRQVALYVAAVARALHASAVVQMADQFAVDQRGLRKSAVAKRRSTASL